MYIIFKGSVGSLLRPAQPQYGTKDEADWMTTGFTTRSIPPQALSKWYRAL